MIYEMVLVKPDSVKLKSYQPQDKLHYVLNGNAISRDARVAGQTVAPIDHKRNPKRRGQQWDGKEWVEIPSKTALTLVNKRINAETTSILYGCNTFDFTTTVALERFLTQIGNNKQHLRAVGLMYTPKGHLFGAGLRAMTALTAASSLQTLSLSNFPVNSMNIDADSEYLSESFRVFVQMLLPVLRSLHATLQAKGRGRDILNVLKINRRLRGDDPHESESRGHAPCGISCMRHHTMFNLYHLKEEHCRAICGNCCVKYRLCYKYIQFTLREEVVTQLGLQ